MNPSVQEIMTLVITSGCLGTSERQQSLLQYLLKEKERGCSNKIKAYNIAVDVLGRPDDFDSSTDSIVRVEMHRLRKNLEQFSGASKDLTLTIPRASYLVEVGDKKPVSKLAEFKPLLATLAVSASALAFMFMGNNKSDIKATPTFVAQNDCSNILPNVSVISSNSSDDLHSYVGKTIRASLAQYTSINLVSDVSECSDSGTPNFGMDYIVLQENGVYRIAITAYNDKISNIIGFSDIAGELTSDHSNEDLYFGILKAMSEFAKPYGTIPQYAATKNWQSKEAQSNYRCLMTMYDSFTTDSQEDYDKSMECLTSAVNSGEASLDLMGGLAGSYIEQKQLYRKNTVENPLEEAKKLIDTAGDRWIDSVEMTLVKITYEVEREDFNLERLEAVLNQAENRYDENPHILLLVSTYSGFKLGDWDRAKQLSDRVKRIHSETDNSVFMIDAPYALLNESPEQVMQTCRLAYSENSLVSNLIVNACARHAKDAAWFEKTNNNLLRLKYSTTDQKVSFIQNKKLDPLFTREVVAALKLPPV